MLSHFMEAEVSYKLNIETWDLNKSRTGFEKYYIEIATLFAYCMSLLLYIHLVIFQMTLVHLFGVYCDKGRITGAMKLLQDMKNAHMVITESIYASMITGHSRADSLEDAEKVLETIKAEGHRAQNTVYTSLMCAYAERGLIDRITEVLHFCVCVLLMQLMGEKYDKWDSSVSRRVI